MVKMKYKTVKVPEWAYENAVKAQNELARRGLDTLPEHIVAPPVCPHCGGDNVNHVHVELDYMRCNGCGFEQQKVVGTGNALVHVGLGVLLGLGVTALLKSSTSKPKPRPRPVPARLSPPASHEVVDSQGTSSTRKRRTAARRAR